MTQGSLVDHLRLYLVAGSHDMPNGLLETIEAALIGGVTAVQLREKFGTDLQILSMAERVRELCRDHDAGFFLNDRLDLALAAGADGVHLGVDDLPVPAARRIAGERFEIGFSPDTDTGARSARLEGASYLGVGPIFGDWIEIGCGARDWTRHLSPARRDSGLPVIGIGGVDSLNAAVIAAGGAGVAVMSAILRAPIPALPPLRYARQSMGLFERPVLMWVTDRTRSDSPLPELARGALRRWSRPHPAARETSIGCRSSCWCARWRASPDRTTPLVLNSNVELARKTGVGVHLPELGRQSLTLEQCLGKADDRAVRPFDRGSRRVIGGRLSYRRSRIRNRIRRWRPPLGSTDSRRSSPRRRRLFSPSVESRPRTCASSSTWRGRRGRTKSADAARHYFRSRIELSNRVGATRE